MKYCTLMEGGRGERGVGGGEGEGGEGEGRKKEEGGGNKKL